MGPKTRPAIALTLDDGWNANDEVLEMVDSLGLRGTAFLVGTVAETMPALPRKLARLGWEVCSHTYTHRILTGLSESQIEAEILKGARAVEKASGQRCRYFRPPGGAANSKVVGVARRLGFTVVNWNASISDTTTADTDPALQVEIALRDIEPGTILLGHFGGTHTVEVLREVLSLSLAAGYRVGTVSELFKGTTAPPSTVVRVLGTPLPRTGSPNEAADPWMRVHARSEPDRESTPLALALLVLPAAAAGALASTMSRRPPVRRKRTSWEASAPPPRRRAGAGR
jgi:peptidoglycan/xylan/chitin deacetylase (PgdA/CDA1 family)